MIVLKEDIEVLLRALESYVTSLRDEMRENEYMGSAGEIVREGLERADRIILRLRECQGKEKPCAR